MRVVRQEAGRPDRLLQLSWSEIMGTGRHGKTWSSSWYRSEGKDDF